MPSPPHPAPNTLSCIFCHTFGDSSQQLVHALIYPLRKICVHKYPGWVNSDGGVALISQLCTHYRKMYEDLFVHPRIFMRCSLNFSKSKFPPHHRQIERHFEYFMLDFQQGFWRWEKVPSAICHSDNLLNILLHPSTDQFPCTIICHVSIPEKVLLYFIYRINLNG